jgi:hypothetical protein
MWREGFAPDAFQLLFALGAESAGRGGAGSLPAMWRRPQSGLPFQLKQGYGPGEANGR